MAFQLSVVADMLYGSASATVVCFEDLLQYDTDSHDSSSCFFAASSRFFVGGGRKLDHSLPNIFYSCASLSSKKTVGILSCVRFDSFLNHKRRLSITSQERGYLFGGGGRQNWAVIWACGDTKGSAVVHYRKGAVMVAQDTIVMGSFQEPM